MRLHYVRVSPKHTVTYTHLKSATLLSAFVVTVIHRLRTSTAGQRQIGRKRGVGFLSTKITS